MKCTAVFCCENGIRDSETHTTSLIGIMDGLDAEALAMPASIPKLTLAIFFERTQNEPNDFTFTIKIKNNNRDITQYLQIGSFQNSLKNIFFTNIFGLPVTENGVLTFSVLHNDVEIGSCSITVNFTLIRVA